MTGQPEPTKGVESVKLEIHIASRTLEALRRKSHAASATTRRRRLGSIDQRQPRNRGTSERQRAPV